MRTRDGYIDTHLREPLVEENAFVRMSPEDVPPPSFEDAWDSLPQPFWEGHEGAIECYRGTWGLAFANLRRSEPGSGFVASFIDTAFNDCLFMWDSAFILFFARYGRRAFDFQRTLENLYARQHPDGFICREIGTFDGKDRFERFDAASTGPNVMPWTEWEHYGVTADSDRLGRVFPVLVSYHRWLRRHRTWRDGTYWTSGLGSGMDNQPRFPQRPAGEVGWPERLTYHGHAVWIDTCLQQVLSADLLLQMADALGRLDEVADLRAERERLSHTINERLWNEETAFYHDELADGALSEVKTVGAYWALLAGVVPQERIASFVGHLEDPEEFKRPHRVPSLSADHPEYDPGGGYWLGSVWPPQILIVPLFTEMNTFGFINTYQGIILPQIASPIAVFIFKQFFDGLPHELEDAALVDGASRFRIYWQIFLPLSRPAMAAVAIFTFVISWNYWLWPFIALTGTNMMTIPVGLATVQSAYGIHNAQIMASAVLGGLPLLIVFLFFQRQIVQGIAGTGLKG